MSNNTIFIAIAALLAIVVISIITYFVMRYLRGSIILNMVNTASNRGDTIKGNFELITRKQIQGNKLTVSLIGNKVTRYYENDERKTRTREIHRSEKVIEGARDYPAGHNAKHEFEIAIPGSSASSSSIDSALGQALSAAAQLINDRDIYYEWRVEVRLDAKGVDLAKSQKISINF